MIHPVPSPQTRFADPALQAEHEKRQAERQAQFQAKHTGRAQALKELRTEEERLEASKEARDAKYIQEESDRLLEEAVKVEFITAADLKAISEFIKATSTLAVRINTAYGQVDALDCRASELKLRGNRNPLASVFLANSGLATKQWNAALGALITAFRVSIQANRADGLGALLSRLTKSL
jgi:hypothetical protein